MVERPPEPNYKRTTRDACDQDAWNPKRRIQSRLTKPDGPSIDYLAGFFDGEGCFTVSMNRHSVPRFVMTVGTTKEREPKLFENRYGGALGTQIHDNPKWSNLYYWRITGHKARIAAENIQPHLIGKKEQCEVFINAIKYKRRTVSSGNTTAQRHTDKIRDYATRLKSFNSGRGKS